jgi:hypothetical protein
MDVRSPTSGLKPSINKWWRINAKSPHPLTDPQREYLKRQVVQALVQEEVFLMEAEKLGIQATDTELAQMIQSIPVFQREGRFDVRAYQEMLGRLRMRVEDFEAEQRRQLMAQKAQFVMASGVRISSLEFPAKLQAALAQAKEEDRKKISENMGQFREDLRRQEVQACLQEWYADVNTRLKIKVLLNKLESSLPPGSRQIIVSPVAAPASAAIFFRPLSGSPITLSKSPLNRRTKGFPRAWAA